MKHLLKITLWIVSSVAALVILLNLVDEKTGIFLVAGTYSIAGIILLCSLISQLHTAILKPAHRLYAKDFSFKFLATIMGLLFIVGAMLYLYVFYIFAHHPQIELDEGHKSEFSNMEYLFRSIFGSLDLFVLDVDTDILNRLDRFGTLKGWISFQAVVSFACTVALIGGLVYSRLRAHFRLNYKTKINDDKNHLYLFFGYNEPSVLLIQDIVKNDPKSIPVIIDEANVDEEENSEFDGIVSFIAHKPKVFKIAENIGAHVAIASQQLHEIDEDISFRPDFDAFGYLGIPKINKFIDKLTRTSDPQLHIFFMDDDEEVNIRNIITLAKDSTILSLAKGDNLSHRIYCHARYNGPNRVIQDVALKKHLDIRIIDSSHMAVELLKLNPEAHPVNVVHTNDKVLTTVDSPFTAMIVGFGEVGRDAFRFLYEFGAFADSKNPTERVKFECQIVDSNLDEIKGTLKDAMPAIFKASQSIGDNATIGFNSLNYNSDEFYRDVFTDEFASKVNYIIISLDDNDEAIALAAKMFNKVRRCREDLSDLRIFVRCTDDDKIERIQKIADHYNFGYGDGESNQPVINIFGQPEKTYTYALVVSDRLLEDGKLFHEKYKALSGEGAGWDQRHRQLTETGVPNIDKLRKLRRQESQDRANALHAATKMILLKDAMRRLAEKNGEDTDWEAFYRGYFNEDGTVRAKGSRKDIHYPGLTDEQNRILLHLAVLEHLRWNAAHQLMGYVFNKDGNSCDERTMSHNCLCSWDKLDAQSDKITDWPCDYKKYDFCVVDTTVALYKDTIHNDKK